MHERTSWRTDLVEADLVEDVETVYYVRVNH
jgi:hypothetical protein